MIRRELYRTREDGVKLYRTYSDAGMKILKDGTEQLYSEAVDVDGCGFTYVETDIPAVPGAELTIQDTLSMLSELGVDTDDHEE